MFESRLEGSFFHSLIVFAATVLIVVGLPGCMTARGYRGERIENGAIIEGKAGQGILFSTANGINLSAATKKIQLKPGLNKIRFTLDRSNINRTGPDMTLYEVSFNAAAGQHYIITDYRGDDRFCVWSISAATREPDFSQPRGCFATVR